MAEWRICGDEDMAVLARQSAPSGALLEGLPSGARAVKFKRFLDEAVIYYGPDRTAQQVVQAVQQFAVCEDGKVFTRTIVTQSGWRPGPALKKGWSVCIWCAHANPPGTWGCEACGST